MAVNGDTKITVNGGEEEEEEFDYSQRSQWLRAAVLGANDGLVSTASLMIGVSAVKEEPRTMIVSGFAGLVAGACSMAIGEFVSVYSQRDIEKTQMKRERKLREETGGVEETSPDGERLPNPFQASAASALSFAVGAVVPLLAAAFVRSYTARVGAVSGAATAALVVFGFVGAVLGGVPVVKSSVRVVVGGWLAMAITYGMMKAFGAAGGL